MSGRLASITLPTGGTISYAYSGGSNGIMCSDGSTAGLKRTTSDGSRTYQRPAPGQPANTTLLTDERGKQSYYWFSTDPLGMLEATHRRAHDGTASDTNLLEEDITCYSGQTPSNGLCDGQALTLPITEADTSTTFNYVATQYSYDGLGRVTSVATPDGHAVTTTYNGRAVRVADSNGPATITQYDALGRSVGVCELISASVSLPGGDSGSACGQYSSPTVAFDVSGTGVTTAYAYNLAAHTVTVYQGAQKRVFRTDAAGRTTGIAEPEMLQIDAKDTSKLTTTFSYAYNSTGLVVTRTRPKANQNTIGMNTTTTTQYDSIGRYISIYL